MPQPLLLLTPELSLEAARTDALLNHRQQCGILI